MRNCQTMKTYTLYESPHNICTASEGFNSKLYEVAPATSTIVVTRTTVSVTTVPCSSIAPAGDLERLNRSVAHSKLNEVAPATSTIVVTKPIVSVTTVPCSSIAPAGDLERLNQSVANQSQPLQALGALLGLVVVVLAIVITGWVWTC